MHTPAPAPRSLDDATSVELWGQVIHGFQATNRALHSTLKTRFNLNEAEVETLLNLFRCPDHRSRHNSLSKSTGFSTGGFTKIADKLTERGITERSACAEDRRVSYLTLTPVGIELAAELTAATAELNRKQFIDVLGPERALLVAEAMTELYRANTPGTATSA